MGLRSDIDDSVQSLLTTASDDREGRVVPEDKDDKDVAKASARSASIDAVYLHSDPADVPA